MRTMKGLSSDGIPLDFHCSLLTDGVIILMKQLKWWIWFPNNDSWSKHKSVLIGSVLKPVSYKQPSMDKEIRIKWKWVFSLFFCLYKY